MLFCVVVVQGVSTIRKRAVAMQATEEQARKEAETAKTAVDTRQEILNDLKRKSEDLLGFLDAWEPHFTRLATPEAAEVNVNALVRQSNLILLAQRFEVVPNKSASSVPNAANETIPKIVRAHLTLEDDFVKSINWLGELESKLPSARLSNLSLVRGQTSNDLRLNAVIDIPMARSSETPSSVSK